MINYKKFFYILICISVFAGCLSSSSAIQTVCFLFSLIGCIFLPIERKFEFIFFLITFFSVIPFGFTGISFPSIIELIILVHYLISFQKLDKLILLCGLILILLALVNTLLISGSLLAIMPTVINLMIFICLYSYIKENNVFVFDSMMKSYIFGAVLSSILGIIMFKDTFFSNTFIRYKGVYSDPNFLGIFMLIAICVLVYFVYAKKMNFFKGSLLILFFTFLGVKTYSRMFLLVFVFMTLYLCFLIFMEKSIKVLLKMFIVLILAVGIIGFVPVMNNIIETRTKYQQSSSDWSNGRFESARDVYEVFVSRLEFCDDRIWIPGKHKHRCG